MCVVQTSALFTCLSGGDTGSAHSSTTRPRSDKLRPLEKYYIYTVYINSSMYLVLFLKAPTPCFASGWANTFRTHRLSISSFTLTLFGARSREKSSGGKIGSGRNMGKKASSSRLM